ncbi:NADH:quinone oxidoreductase subunit E [Gammaproteobacteria bacterium]
MSTEPEEIVSEAVTLSAPVREEIDRWITKYPPDRKQSAVMAALRVVQDDNGGWLSRAHLEAVARYLDIPPIAVYEVATFYSMYDLEPVGRHKVCVCTNISCMLRGSDEVMAHLSQRLGIKPGETTADGRFTLREVECLGACVGAPMMQIGRQYHENLTSERIDRILDNLE